MESSMFCNGDNSLTVRSTRGPATRGTAGSPERGVFCLGGNSPTLRPTRGPVARAFSARAVLRWLPGRRLLKIRFALFFLVFSYFGLNFSLFSNSTPVVNIYRFWLLTFPYSWGLWLLLPLSLLFAVCHFGQHGIMLQFRTFLRSGYVSLPRCFTDQKQIICAFFGENITLLYAFCNFSPE